VDEQAMPSRLDTTSAHVARVYDYWLGGKDNFAVDRAHGDELEQRVPAIRTAALMNRRFLGRAVRYLTGEAGNRQFLDIGTGLPTANNTHEVAQAIAPESRVVYTAANATNRAHKVDFRFRSHAEVSRFFDGLHLVEPGIVPVAEWHPDGGPTPTREESNIWAGVARVP
jgi:hypothetical protein